MKAQTRRTLLRTGLGSIGFAALSGIGQRTAWAAGGGNRTLVCVYLNGGADTNSLIVPLEPQAYREYAAARGGLALPPGSLLPVNSIRQQGTFGFPAQAPELATLYRQGALAVIANAGDLTQPLTKGQALANPNAIPKDTFQHSARGKMAYYPEGYMAPVWASTVLGKTAAKSPRDIFQLERGVSAATQSGDWLREGKGERYTKLLNSVKGMRLRTQFPDGLLGPQLAVAARMASVGLSEGLGNQIITVIHDGFEASSYAGTRTATLFAELSQGMMAFYQATQELGIAHGVSAFTWSEFNRTLRPNQAMGSDGAWGSHHLVMGASVAGGEIYGKFPSLELGGPDDLTGAGLLLPTASSAQVAATHAAWLGVPPSQLQGMLPSLRLFAPQDLGFYGMNG